MGARPRFLLNGVLAGLFALTILPAPGQHAHMVLERAAFAIAYAMPDGTLPEFCATGHDTPTDGHDRHLFTPACYACVIMGAPGLPVAPFVPASRTAFLVIAARRRGVVGARPVSA